MKIWFVLILICPLTWAKGFKSNGKHWYTHTPNTHPQKRDPLAVYPAINIPTNPDDYQWEIKLNTSKEDQQGPVPTYTLDTLSHAFNPTTSLSSGTIITIEKVVGRNQKLYYGVLPEGSPPDQTVVWVSGYHIHPKALKNKSD